MNGNNSWQRMGQFARSPRRDLGPVSQPPAGELFPVGQLMEGGGIPAPAMMPQQPMPQQQMPQQYGQGQPQGKKILGMPKDRFIALMGTIAQAFGGDSPSGRMGTGLVSMADMMRGERMAQGERQAAETKARRKAAAQTAKEKREAATKKKGKAPTVRTFRVGDMDVQHSFNYDTRKWEPISGMKGKKVKEVEEKKKAPTVRTFRVGEMDVQHEYDFDTKKWEPISGMPGKKVKPPAGEKPKEMSWAEKRARAKEKRDLESSILNPANLEDPRLQVNIEAFNELPGPYVYHRTLGTPAKETGYFDLERDVPAVPSTIEKVDVSTPEKIRDSDLPVEIKLRLLKTRFGYE